MHFLVGVLQGSVAAHEIPLHEHHLEAKDTGIKSAFEVFTLIHPYLLLDVATSGTNNESQAPSSAPYSFLKPQSADSPHWGGLAIYQQCFGAP